MQKLRLDELSLDGKRVLVRVDFNVPLRQHADGTRSVADGTRVRAALPTIRAIQRAGGKAILLSHLGRPKGAVRADLSLAPVANYLQAQLGASVCFVRATVGPSAVRAVDALAAGGVLLLENTRFHRGETANHADFAASLAALGDMFVNDAFGTAHRAHASNVGVASRVPQAAAGYLLDHELSQLRRITESPLRPVAALVGGAKVSDKIGVLTNLAGIVDTILVGGAMSYTFLKALGRATGRSLVEHDRLENALGIYRAARGKLRLPVDHITSTGISDIQGRALYTGDIPDGQAGLDIGPDTITAYRKAILEARTVIWNGPMGVFEVDAFAHGTNAMARTLADATRRGATTVVGGGDSVAAITQAGLADQVTHVCTGGGAMLDFLEGKTLPGVAALTDRT